MILPLVFRMDYAIENHYGVNMIEKVDHYFKSFLPKYRECDYLTGNYHAVAENVGNTVLRKGTRHLDLRSDVQLERNTLRISESR